MFHKNVNRWLSLLLYFCMISSLLPVSAFATETNTEEPSAETASEILLYENPIVQEYQTRMTDMLVYYLGSADVAPGDVPALAALLDEYALSDAAFEILVMAEDMTYSMEDGLMNEEDAKLFIDNNPAAVAFSDYVMEYAKMPEISLYKDHTPIDGITVSVSSATNESMSGGAVTVTAKGSSGFLGWGASAKTATITITNNTGSNGTVSLDWTASSVYELKIDGTKTADTSGSFSKTLSAGGKFTITVTTDKNSTTNKLVMSNFSFAASLSAAKITVNYDEKLGSVTANGSTVEANTVYSFVAEGDKKSIDFVASPNLGTGFIAWVESSTNKILSTSTTCNIEPSAGEMAIRAVFGSHACFQVNGYLYETLTSAVEATGGSGTVVLMNNGTLPAGNYTIPGGVTLLIPFDAANTLYTSSPTMCSIDADGIAYTTPVFYRTLTMAGGANITVNGAISLPAKVSVNFGYNGMPTGDVSHIRMNQNSSITLESGSKLYAWGYITGEGSVNAKSGSTVYECFQLKDWRGGSQSTDDDMKSNKVFPFSQYYLQNVEVPLTVQSGASLKGYFGIYSGGLAGIGAGNYAAEPVFISNGSSSLFKLSSGSITIDYIEESDRLKLDLNGTLDIQNYTIKVSIYSMKTGDFVFPVTNNFIVNVNSGAKMTVSTDAALLPGAQINIAETGTITVNSGKKLIVYDGDQWGNYCYYEGYNVKFVPLEYAPGRTKTRTETDLADAAVCVNGEVDASAGAFYTTDKGANIYSTGNGVVRNAAASNTTTNQFKQADYEGNAATYVSIPITPAKLKHQDGTYLETTTGTYTHKHYVASGNTGKWDASGHTETETTTATCEAAGITTYTCTCGFRHEENVPALGHTAGSAADCDNAQTCTVCGATLETALGHDYNAVVTEPTCTEEGYTTHTCSRCGDSYVSNKISANGHSFTAWSVTKNANCTDEGSKSRSCNTCGETETQKIPATGHNILTVDAQAPTFDSVGWNAYEYCMNSYCDYTTYVEIPKLIAVAKVGETRYESIEKALSAAKEISNPVVVLMADISTSVTVRQEVEILKGSYTAQIIPGDGYAMSDENGVVKVWKLLDIVYGTNIRVGDTLDLYFYLYKNLFAEGYTVEISREKEVTDETTGVVSVQTETIKKSYTDLKPYGNDYLRFSYDGFAAKEMADTVSVTIFDSDGKQIGRTVTESIETYALRSLNRNTSNTELCTTLVDMLNYGAAAQNEFGYREETLANVKLSENQVGTEQIEPVTDTKWLTEKGNYGLSATITAKANLYFTFYFSGFDSIIDDLTATATYKDHYGNPKTVEVEKGNFVKLTDKSGNIYYGAKVTGLAIADGRQIITCTVKNGDAVVAKVQSSIQSYIYENVVNNGTEDAEMITLCKELMKFIDSAYKFFH